MEFAKFCNSIGYCEAYLDAYGLHSELRWPVVGQVSVLHFPDTLSTNSPTLEGQRDWLAWVKNLNYEPQIGAGSSSDCTTTTTLHEGSRFSIYESEELRQY